ncbi:hypothetical protein J4464_07205 [Candidatus Woesearchaeota archaeon]|nr:hypothetical protein [Candidatus Woesearchaeota archaeon]
MSIVGFSFTKITAERKSSVRGKVNINNNIGIKDVKERELSFSKDQSGLEFQFEFTADYEPQLGSIKLNGEVLYMESSKKVSEVMDRWKKEKKLDQELMTKILNSVLMKCNVQALILSQDLNLPPPIPLPKINVNKPGK